ncbi:MAG: hypothetical protein JSR72_00125 [Proteobacteria bacterium]|nr:hypothetical protein [Pseudomonadota bacterium]
MSQLTSLQIHGRAAPRDEQYFPLREYRAPSTDQVLLLSRRNLRLDARWPGR